MRSLTELMELHDPAWPEIEAAVAAAPYPVVVFARDPQRADEELLRMQVTTRSWLGAVVHHSGGLVIDHGWLRVLGSGNDEHHLVSLGKHNDTIAGGMIVAQDVLGGQFAWMPNAAGKPTIWYLAPDTLSWEDCERGYGVPPAGANGGGDVSDGRHPARPGRRLKPGAVTAAMIGWARCWCSGGSAPARPRFEWSPINLPSRCIRST